MSARLPGHSLSEGSTACSCGEESPTVASDRARRRWHRAHKEERRAAEFPADHGRERDSEGHCLCRVCHDRQRESKARHQGSESAQRRRHEWNRQQTLTGGRPNESGWPVMVQQGRGSWLIARSCLRCHALRMADEFCAARGGKRRSICKACDLASLRASTTPERAKQNRDAYYERNREAEDQRTKTNRTDRQHRSLDRATRSAERRQWTGPELELVATRDDLTLNQLAAMLGRTYAAVAKQSSLIRRDLGMSPLIAGAEAARRD